MQAPHEQRQKEQARLQARLTQPCSGLDISLLPHLQPEESNLDPQDWWVDEMTSKNSQTCV